MDENQFEEFMDILDIVSEQYGKPLSSGAKMLYWQGLKDISFDVIKQALFKHIRNPDTGVFMPKIADIIRMTQGSTLDAALSAWSKVDKAARQKGPYVDVVFDDPLIHKVLHDMGGWIQLGNKTEEEWPFVAREFENRHRGFRARSETPDYPPVLTGIANAYNRSKGIELEPMVMIGDESACRKVLSGGSDKPLIQFNSVSNSARESIKRIENN